MSSILSDDVIEHLILYIDWENLEKYCKMSVLPRSFLCLFRKRYDSMLKFRDRVCGLIPKNISKRTMHNTIIDGTLYRCDSFIDYLDPLFYFSPFSSCTGCVANLVSFFHSNIIHVSQQGMFLFFTLTMNNITIYIQLNHRHCLFSKDGTLVSFQSGCFLCNLLCEKHMKFFS
jgi:hypothetical protein